MLINETKKWGAQVYITHIIGGVNDANFTAGSLWRYRQCICVR